MIDSFTKKAAAQVELALSEVPSAQRISGRPSTGAMNLGQFGGVNVGVWEMTPGVMSDTEVDEIFIVLFGKGTVEFSDGKTISLAAGDVVRLHAGQQTVWTVSDTLRKIYLSLRS